MPARSLIPAALLAVCLLTATGLPASAADAREKMEARSYPVADLIVPLEHAARGKRPKTLEDRFMRLIVRAVCPSSWEQNGGPGTIDYYPLGMSLVVNQTLRVHAQIAGLLASLRKAQEVEVALEVRFVSVPDGFVEKLGIMGGKDKVVYIRQVGEDGIERLGVDFENSAGPTFLTTKQVARLMEAVQGEQRAEVMQAPKVTFANGQEATVEITDTRYFLTGIDVVRRNGQVTLVPRNEPKKIGFRMTAQPVVSADRRFVQVFLKMNRTELISPEVPALSLVVPFEGKELTSLRFQQPRFNTITIDKTVTIPDGGTVLFGGFRKVSVGRNEFGPPVLSQIPYLNRLFKNVGYGRETSQVLVLVTPRILIADEAEEKVPAVSCPASAVKAPITSCPASVSK